RGFKRFVTRYLFDFENVIGNLLEDRVRFRTHGIHATVMNYLRNISSSEIQRHKRPRCRSDIVGIWTNQLVIRTLLHDVCRPTANASEDKNWSEQRGWNAHEMVDGSREKICICKELFLLPHNLFDCRRNLKEVAVLLLRRRRQPPGPLLDDRVTRIARAINGVAKSHDFPFPSQNCSNSFASLFRRLEFRNKFHRGLVRSTMERPAQRTDCPRDTGIKVRQGGCANSRGEGRGIEFMFGI